MVLTKNAVKMRATAITTLILNLENLILEAELHKRFNIQVIPLRVEQRITLPHPNKTKYQ